LKRAEAIRGQSEKVKLMVVISNAATEGSAEKYYELIGFGIVKGSCPGDSCLWADRSRRFAYLEMTAFFMPVLPDERFF